MTTSRDITCPCPDLPEDVLNEIFQYLERKSLLNCRLVCTSWNNAFVNSVSSLRKIRFRVEDVAKFLATLSRSNLLIRHIKFHEPTLGSPQEIEELFKIIGPTVESVSFHFEGYGGPCADVQEGLLFSSLVSNCVNVKDIYISATSFEFIRKLTETEVQDFATKVQQVSIDISTDKFPPTVCGTSKLSDFVLCLANLQTIRLSGINVFDEMEEINAGPSCLVEMVCEYMERYKYSGNLKTIHLENSHWCWGNHATRDPMFKLYIESGKHNINCVGLTQEFPLNKLLAFASICPEKFNESCCKNIRAGFLDTLDLGHGTRQLALCTEMTVLQMNLRRPLRYPESQFLTQLKKLSYLNISNTANEMDSLELESLLPSGLPSLSAISIDRDTFTSDSFRLFNSTFPNLVNLKLDCHNNLPDDIIAVLVNLEKLEVLCFKQSNLTDRMLVQPYQVNSDESDEPKFVPVIAALKTLQRLEIVNCDELTNVALIDGIVHCESLYFRFSGGANGAINDEGLNVLRITRRIRMTLRSGQHASLF